MARKAKTEAERQAKEIVEGTSGEVKSAAKAVAEMGMGPIVNLTGGFGAWKKAGGPISD